MGGHRTPVDRLPEHTNCKQDFTKMDLSGVILSYFDNTLALYMG